MATAKPPVRADALTACTLGCYTGRGGARMHSRMIRLLVVLAFAPLAAFACTHDPQAPAAPGTRVLFIGNSLTYTNDLPEMVRVLAESAGTPLVTGMIAVGGRSLEDHWNDGDVRAAVASRRWDVVVLQQGPSAWPSSRENLREYTGRWATAIRAAGAEPVVYMPWPESWRMSAFDSVSLSYRQAAEVASALLVPGGDAWQAAWRRDASLALYGADGFHPSRLGTYVVAVATWARLTGRSPADAPSRLQLEAGLLEVDASRAAAVRAAVEEALRGAGAEVPE